MTRSPGAAQQVPGVAPLPVHFLMYNVNARDGVSRAVLTLANELVRGRPVEIISLYHLSGAPAYPMAEGLRVSYLLDHAPVPRGLVQPGRTRPHPRYARRLVTRHPVRNFLARRASRLAAGRNFPNFSMLTDRLLARKLRTIDRGVIISTRPALHLASARLAPDGVITIGQDHLNFQSRATEPGSMSFIQDACEQGLDAFVTLTEADAADYSRTLAGTRTVVRAIPNALSWPLGPARTEAGRIVVTAGRLVPRKGMGRLIRAFAPVARRHRDWELRIYGTGPLEQRLETQIERLGLGDQIRLMGHTSDLPSAFQEAAVFASASSAEGFPMVMLEALSTGLPLVGTDCPRGPGEIIRTGENGLLVPNRDVGALTTALEAVVSDEALRRSLGEKALADAATYTPSRIAARWDALVADLQRPGPVT